MNNDLFENFDNIFSYCFQLFKDKNSDYGPTWLLYRYQSLNDEIWRKAKRIRTLEEKQDKACIDEGRDVEYVGIINYCIMFLIKIENSIGLPTNRDITDDIFVLDSLKPETIFKAYADNVGKIKELLKKKNSDYGDAWKSMSLGAMTDQLIIRSYRIRRIIENDGQCKVSEGISSQLYDIINYCIFALIKMDTDSIKIV
ncbi:MAG: DUF1599 domain-containing protein [Ruminococcus sp.]|nr:DUF1599 domain-containing protein [Candidatus Copronaster equi]